MRYFPPRTSLLVALPLTDETKDLIGETELGLLPVGRSDKPDDN